uniref:ataxin-7-like protein 2b isoform X2 n=1 Tax=Scatophagus argus TaxID=75038 RepID=UPI001ED7EC13|nr:ataxin-7-like protein 2b isoform X2 [Scatophagus argus]
MAALDRRNPNLDEFIGLNWSCWVDRVNILPSDAVDTSKYGRNCSETMTLRKEDMHIYGHCPAHDEIYLVVCNHCGQIVKPQAFEKHCELRHGPLTKICGQSSSFAPQQRPRPGRPLSNLSSSRERQKDSRRHDAGAPSSAALPVRQHRSAKAQKEAVSAPSVEKFPDKNLPLPHHTSSTPQPRVPSWLSEPLPPGHCSSSASSSERPSAQKLTAGRSSDSHSVLRGVRTYSRIYKNVDKKECDLNKHCRILDPEGKKLCNQERICNTEPIQQQKLMGKTKIFDRLAVEQRTAPASQDMEQLLVKSKDKEQRWEAFEEKSTAQSNKYNFNSNCPIQRPRDPSESFQEEESNSTVEVEVQPPYPFNQSLLSSDESEDDEQEGFTDLPAAPWHPKPLGLCTFGCRSLGCSIFTFDRRWHHLQFALSAMLEHHVSTHLWKKMPQVSSGLRSCYAPPPTAGSPIRSGVRHSKPSGYLNLESTSLEQQETKSSRHNAHSTKPPFSTTSSSQRHNPLGRPSKARRMEVELMQDVSSEKAVKPSDSGEDKSPRYIRDPPLHEKGQPHVLSSPAPVNGTFSLRKKPCPPLQRSPRSREVPLGIQQKVVGYDHRGLAQKRRGSIESPPFGSSLSKNIKSQCLSSPSRSSLLAWQGENIGEVLRSGS